MSKTKILQMVAITKDSLELEGRDIKLFCPKFFWQILEGRAKAHHNGDLQEAINYVFSRFGDAWLQEIMQPISHGNVLN